MSARVVTPVTEQYHNLLRVYRQINSNLKQINSEWPLAKAPIEANGIPADNDPVRNQILTNLRKIAAASALISSGIAQFIINLDAGPIHAIELMNASNKPVLADSFWADPAALYGGKKKKLPSPKKKPSSAKKPKSSPKKKTAKK